jgi:hypothetical protein
LKDILSSQKFIHKHAKLYKRLLGIPVTFNSDNACSAIHYSDDFFTKPFPGTNREILLACIKHLDSAIENGKKTRH